MFSFFPNTMVVTQLLKAVVSSFFHPERQFPPLSASSTPGSSLPLRISRGLDRSIGPRVLWSGGQTFAESPQPLF